MPKVIPGPDAEDLDLEYPQEQEDLESCLERCSQHLKGFPEPIQRKWIKSKENSEAIAGEDIRVLQWNVLSQG